MAADGTPGAKNQPQFLDGGAPDIGVDPGLVADYAAKVGNRRVGTTAERVAATGNDVWEGLLWGDTTDGIEYKRYGTGWKAMSKPKTAYTPAVGGIGGGAAPGVWSISSGMVEVAGQTATVLFSAVTGPVTITIPFGTLDSGIGTYCGSGLLVDLSTGDVYPVVIRRNNNNSVVVERIDTSGANAISKSLPGTVGITPTNGVLLSYNFSYMAA